MDINAVIDAEKPPTEQEYTDVTAILETLKQLRIEFQTSTIKMDRIASKFDAIQKSSIKEESEKEWDVFKRHIDKLIKRGKDFCSTFQSRPSASSYISPSPTASSPIKKLNLERLPLPTFNGLKTDYLRFKKAFKTHVNYETEAEKVLALKTKCLTKSFDQEKIANLDSLEECWNVLDKKYGNVPTLVSEIYTTWKNLKMPTTDEQFVKFAESIERGSFTLKSMDFYDKMDNCYLTIEMECKLNETLRREYSKKYLKPDADPLKRWENFLTFVDEEKVAAEARIASFSAITTPKKENDDSEIINHQTGTSSRGRGGSHGSGGGKGAGRGKPSKQPNDNSSKPGDKSSRGKGRGAANNSKRGNQNNSCLHSAPEGRLS